MHVRCGSAEFEDGMGAEDLLNAADTALIAAKGDGPDAGWRILAPNHAPGADPACVARANARHVLDSLAAASPDAILVIGGDTAFAVVAELGLPPLLPVREIVPGVPVTRIEATQLAQALPGRRRDLFLITKAGGFGERDVLCRVRERLDSYGG